MKLREEGRVGRFRISGFFIEEGDDERMLKFMGNFFVVRAEHHYASDWIEYTAYSPLFSVTDKGDLIPLYVVKISTDGSVEAHEIDDVD